MRKRYGRYGETTDTCGLLRSGRLAPIMNDMAPGKNLPSAALVAKERAQRSHEWQIRIHESAVRVTGRSRRDRRCRNSIPRRQPSKRALSMRFGMRCPRYAERQ